MLRTRYSLRAFGTEELVCYGRYQCTKSVLTRSVRMVYERYADALLGAYDLNINPGSTTSSSSSSSQTAGSEPRLQLLQLRNPWGQPPPGSSSSSRLMARRNGR
eukprot:COSAG06_NODE_10852_length_1607_cov_1.610080_2_plen_104_part_00